MKISKHKPIIETLINTSALALTAWAVTLITQSPDSWNGIMKGIVVICFGAGLEYFKYFGRHKNLW